MRKSNYEKLKNRKKTKRRRRKSERGRGRESRESIVKDTMEEWQRKKRRKSGKNVFLGKINIQLTCKSSMIDKMFEINENNNIEIKEE